MATTTTNLSLKKPALDDDALIADINDNMDTLDSTIGAPSTASAVDGANAFAKINSLNSNKANQSDVNKLDSNTNETTDILASALACTKTTFFKTSGSSSYTGTLPSNDYKVSTFIVNVRGGGRFVTATNSVGGVATNYYTGNAWAGWQELALNSSIPKYLISSENTSSVSPNTNSSVTVPVPTGATSVLAIIPIGFVPADHWNSTIVYTNSNGRVISFRCVGSGNAQMFAVRYCAIYI